MMETFKIIFRDIDGEVKEKIVVSDNPTVYNGFLWFSDIINNRVLYLIQAGMVLSVEAMVMALPIEAVEE